MRWKIPAVALLLLAAAACQDNTNLPPLDAASASAGAERIPTRAQESPRGSAHRTDAELWQRIAQGGGKAMVGLKAPGRPRGVWKHEILVSPAEWSQGRAAVRALPGITYLEDLPPLPVALVHVADPAALARLRALPMVDYVEPARSPKAGASAGGPELRSSSESGSSSCSAPESYSEPYMGQTSLGDKYGYSYGGNHNHVVDAWRRSQGDNVRVAFIDTGMDPDQGQFTDPAQFNPRPAEYTRAFYMVDATGGTGHDQCGHGTRMIGVAGAPNDGRSVVGVAYKADVISVRAGDNLLDFEAEYVYKGIQLAMAPSRPAHVINMAFWSENTFWYSVTDIIRYYYHGANGPVFIAAIGTDPLAGGVPNAIFPSDVDEVIAVVATDRNGQREWSSHYGPKAELSGFVPQATVDVPRRWGVQGITRIMGSSGASASMTGVAALVRARYPALTNKQVRQQLRFATHTSGLEHSWSIGYGIMDAHKAVGGLYNVDISTTAEPGPFDTYTYTLTATHQGGDGPFTYLWTTGETTRSITFTVYPGDGLVQYGVSVTDLYDGAVRGAQQTIVAPGGMSGCEDPTQIICG